jgi:alkanesulfonate monooxygenase
VYFKLDQSMSVVPITSADVDAAEVAWFSALCSDDYRYLGVPDGALRSSWEHCSDIVKTVRGARVSQYPVPVVLSGRAGYAELRRRLRADHVDRINLLAAVRCGEMQPIMLARTIATLDHMLKGRLTINIISVGLSRRDRRQRLSLSTLARGGADPAAGLDADEIDFDGQVYQFHGV